MKKIVLFVLILFAPFFIYSTGTNDDSSKGIIITKSKNLGNNSRNIKELEEYKNSKRWAIVIGINNYEDKFIAGLKKAQNDAKGIDDLLKHEGQFDYVFTFTDDSKKDSGNYPSLNNIVAKLEFLKNEVKPEDTFVFFFSGHGISDGDGRAYLLLADTVISQAYKTSLPLFEIENYISSMKVKKNIVFLDACRNAVEKTKGINTRTIINEKNAQAEISAIMYSTSTGEFSYEHDKEPYGVFTSFLLNGFRGAADKNNDTMVTFNEIREYVEEGVKDWSIKRNKSQKPYSSINGEFHGDVVLSIIPLKDRAKYNPLSLKNSYYKQMNLYHGLNYSSLSVMITGLTGTTAGIIVGSVGYYKYNNLGADAKADDFKTYWDMKDSGYWCAIGFGSLALSAVVPFIISYTIKPKESKNNFEKISFNFSSTPEMLTFYTKISF